MKKVILIKYGELTTKKDNRNIFINALSKNLKEQLKKYNTNIIKDRSRMYIEFLDKDFNNISSIVKNTFGIHEFNLAYKTETNLENIQQLIKEELTKKDFNTFKVITKRRDKNFPIKSMEYSDIMGGFILKNIPNIKVDVKNPEITVHIEINKLESYVYFNKIKGLGGYPVGVQGKGLLMLSGGIDSPVAGFLALKKGITIDAIYFEALPHTSLNAREKVIKLAKELLKYTTNINLHIVSITKLQEEVYSKIDNTYMITILRRMMYRISEDIANKNNCLILINGESIGQVASQTLTSISVINNVVDIPVIRPVACMDKLEIIDIAEQINTYETSILPFEDCCTVFVPKHPCINPRIDKCIKYESMIEYQKLIDEATNNIITININKKETSSLL